MPLETLKEQRAKMYEERRAFYEEERRRKREEQEAARERAAYGVEESRKTEKHKTKVRSQQRDVENIRQEDKVALYESMRESKAESFSEQQDRLQVQNDLLRVKAEQRETEEAAKREALAAKIDMRIAEAEAARELDAQRKQEELDALEVQRQAVENRARAKEDERRKRKELNAARYNERKETFEAARAVKAEEAQREQDHLEVQREMHEFEQLKREREEAARREALAAQMEARAADFESARAQREEERQNELDKLAIEREAVEARMRAKEEEEERVRELKRIQGQEQKEFFLAQRELTESEKADQLSPKYHGGAWSKGDGTSMDGVGPRRNNLRRISSMGSLTAAKTRQYQRRKAEDRDDPGLAEEWKGYADKERQKQEFLDLITPPGTKLQRVIRDVKGNVTIVDGLLSFHEGNNSVVFSPDPETKKSARSSWLRTMSSSPLKKRPTGSKAEMFALDRLKAVKLASSADNEFGVTLKFDGHNLDLALEDQQMADVLYIGFADM